MEHPGLELSKQRVALQEPELWRHTATGSLCCRGGCGQSSEAEARWSAEARAVLRGTAASPQPRVHPVRTNLMPPDRSPELPPARQSCRPLATPARALGASDFQSRAATVDPNWAHLIPTR